MSKYGLIPAEEEDMGTICFYIYEYSEDMRNWIGFVVFTGRDYKISSFRKNPTLTEQLELCRLCAQKAQELSA